MTTTVPLGTFIFLSEKLKLYVHGYFSYISECIVDLAVNNASRGNRGGGRARGRAPVSGRTKEPLKFDGDFDFESSNAKFDKEEIEKELKKKLTISKTGSHSPLGSLFSHPPKRRRVTYASTIRPASASASVSTLSTSSMKPLHGMISYCTCILV